MPASFLTYLRRSRRPIVVLAAGLFLLQGVMAGLATAHAAALAANPFVAAICHGADPATGNAPDNGKAAVCCAFCATAGSALVPDLAPVLARFALARSPLLPDLSPAGISLDPRAVRAGSSQAPPIRA